MELFRLENVRFVLFICSSNVHTYVIEIYDLEKEFGQEGRKFKKVHQHHLLLVDKGKIVARKVRVKVYM